MLLIVAYQNIVLTEQTYMETNEMAFIHNKEAITKNTDLTYWEEVFYSESQIAGPIQLDNVNRILYVVKGLEKDYLDEEEPAEELELAHG